VPNLIWGGQLNKTNPGEGDAIKERGLFMRIIHEDTPQSTSTAKNAYRERIDLLRSRVDLLTGKDRLLMTMYLENGNTFRQMAQLAGVSEASIGRRIQKLTKRLIDGKYITCLRNRDKFTKTEMAVARDYFLLGLSQRKISSKRNCSVYEIRKILKRIQQLVETADEG